MPVYIFFYVLKQKKARRDLFPIYLWKESKDSFCSLSGKKEHNCNFLNYVRCHSKKVPALAQSPMGASASVRVCTNLELVSFSTGERKACYSILDLRKCFRFTTGILKMPSQSPKHCCVILNCAERKSKRQILQK